MHKTAVSTTSVTFFVLVEQKKKQKKRTMAETLEDVQAKADQSLREYLLGSQLYDILTLAQFKNLFPAKYK